MNTALWKNRFGEHLQVRHFSPRTVESYTAAIEPFFEFLDAVGVRELANVTRDVVEEYRTHLYYREHRGKKIGVKTQAQRLGAIKTFLKFLTRERYLLLDPGAGVELPRVPRTVPHVLLSEEEMIQLLAAPNTEHYLGLRDRAILEMLYGTALRNSELSKLCLDELDVEKCEIRLQQGKGGKGRVLPLGDEAAAWTKRYLDRSRPLLLRSSTETTVFLSNRGIPFDKGTLAAVVRRNGERAGLFKIVTPHVLRHACATHMLRAGAGIRHLQKLLGHECLSTTQRYTNIEVSDLRQVVQQYHPRETGVKP